MKTADYDPLPIGASPHGLHMQRYCLDSSPLIVNVLLVLVGTSSPKPPVDVANKFKLLELYK